MENPTFFYDVLNFLKGSTFSQIVGIIAILLTIYFYRKSKKSRNPTYIIRTINLIKEKIQKIETVQIRYSGEIINNLSISKIAFWNDGKETINSTDVAQKKPIIIKINEEFEILDAEILFQKNEANDFKITISDDHKYISVTFDYFDFEEGFVLQVYHTGNDSEDLVIEGQIKTVKMIIRKDISKALFPFVSSSKSNKKIAGTVNKKAVKAVIGWVFFIFGVFLTIFYPIFYFLKIPISEPVDPSKYSLSMHIAFIFIGLMYCWMGYHSIRRHIPKGFNVFNDEM